MMYNFKGPIPGESLTKELGNYPWENPPQFNTLDEGIDYYLKILSDEDVQDDLMVMMEIGVPIDIIADSITTGGTMNGKHTLDLAYLLNPVLEEFIKAKAEVMGLTYLSSFDDIKKGTKAKAEREKKQLSALLSADLKGVSKEKIMADAGLSLVKKVKETLDDNETDRKTIEPKDSDIEIKATPSGALESPRKGLMGKVT